MACKISDHCLYLSLDQGDHIYTDALYNRSKIEVMEQKINIISWTPVIGF